MFNRLLAILALLATACSPAAAPAPTVAPAAATRPTAAATHTVRLGASNAGATNAPFYLAEELGYFAGQGIALDQVFFPSASEVIPALTRGDLDGAVVGVNPATLNALAGNFGIKLVADGGSQLPGFASNVFVVAREMEGTIKGPADLRGRKVALTPPGLGTASGYMLSKYLAQANLTPSDVDITPLTFPDQVAALSNHSIDAALMAEPFATRVVQTGGGALLVPGDKVSPGQQVVAIVFSERFITAQREIGVQLLTAFLQGARKYMAAFSTGEDRDHVIQILVQKTDIKDPELWKQIYPTGVNPNGELNLQSMLDAQDYFQKLGLVQNPVDFARAMDPTFIQSAVQQLGPAPTPQPRS